MRYEFLHALKELDQKTPVFFRLEALSRDGRGVRLAALRTLRGLDPARGHVADLRRLLSVLPRQDNP